MNGTRCVHEEEGAQVAVQVVDGCRVGEKEGGSHFRKVVHQLRYGRLNLISEDLASNLDGGGKSTCKPICLARNAKIQNYVKKLTFGKKTTMKLKTYWLLSELLSSISTATTYSRNARDCTSMDTYFLSMTYIGGIGR